MLKLLRKKGVMKKILWVVAVVIIFSFGFFGTANYLAKRGQARYAGKIFGKPVSFDDFRKAMMHVRNQAIMRYGDKFFEIQEFLNLEAETWNRLILLHEAKKRNIKVKDEEVRDAILNFAFFQRNGKFDQQLYNNVLRYAFRCEPRFFEEGVRESLIFAKLYDEETSFVAIPESILFKEYQKKNEKAKASYVIFDSKDYENQVEVSPEEIQQYYQKNPEEFRTPEEIKIQFLSFPFPEDAKETDKNNVAIKAKTIEQKLQENPDLLAVASENNIAVMESDFFSMEKPDLKLGWPLEVLQKAFLLKDGKISNALKTPKGYYIITVKERKESYIPELTDIEQNVRKNLISNKAKAIAKEKSSEYRKKIDQALEKDPGQGFAKAAENLGLKVETTPLFVRRQYLPNLGISREFQEAVFGLTDNNDVSEIIPISKGYAIASRDEFVPADEEKFEEEKGAFRDALLEQRKNEVFSDFIMRLRTKADLQSNLSSKQKQ